MKRVPAEAAVGQRNRFAKWPSKTARERLHPICSPSINPSFSLERGESVFTIGSCFARNIEFALRARGFKVPCLDFSAPDGEAYPGEFASAMLNKYTPAGMLNEVRHAFSPNSCPDFLVPHNGGVVDLQLHAGAPVSRERGEQRRREVGALYESAIKQSRVVIITLGLVEAWWDNVAGCYLNNMPAWEVVAANKGRFEFEVLDFATCSAMVREMIEIIRTSRNDVRVLLSVSPVPLLRTFTDQDVITANAHSKAVLRAVAGEIAHDLPFVDYYPSFESVTLSDADLAWEDDLRHVTKQLVRHNVERMISHYAEALAPASAAAL